MITPKDCLEKFGDPEKESSMFVWFVPDDITDKLHTIPRKIYCNRIMAQHLVIAFRNIIKRNLVDQLKTYDGCFNIRKQRGALSQSLHSWGVAIDLNANWNRLGTIGNMTPEFVKCFTDAGFNWGGNFHSRKDPMHFELASLT